MKTSKLPAVVWGISLVVFVLSVGLAGSDLPVRVATHFDAAGRANGWMTRSAANAFTILVGGGLSVFMIGLCYSFRFFPSSTLNVPHADYWRSPENYPKACAFIFSRSFWFGTLCLLFMTLLQLLVVRANRSSPPSLPTSGVAGLALAFLAGGAAWAISLVRHFRNLPPSAP